MARPVYVVIDTNVAIQDSYFFFKKQGPELLDAMRRAGARLLVPEILRQEYLDNFVVIGRQSRGALAKGVSKARPFFDHQLNHFFPSDEEVRDRARLVLEGLQDVVTIIPETDALLIATGQRVKAKLAPCTKTDHGYKDCLIWESVLSMAKGSEVHIVTKDKAFYRDDTSDELAPSILVEAEANGISIYGYCEKKQGDDAMPLARVLKAILAHVPAADPNALNLVDLKNTGPSTTPTDGAVGADTGDRSDENIEHAPTSGMPDAQPSADQSELDRLLEPVRAEFWRLDGKVLGVIAFLNGHDKNHLYELLGQIGIDPAHAQNSCDRLTLAGLIKDTGHHLLPNLGRVTGLAAALVEGDVIELMLRNG